jgi:hypothetical protein
MPDGSDRVNHEPCREAVSTRDACGPGRATSNGQALGKQLGAGSPVNGTVHASAAAQRLVGGIHDRIDSLLRDVSAKDLERCAL